MDGNGQVLQCDLRKGNDCDVETGKPLRHKDT